MKRLSMRILALILDSVLVFVITAAISATNIINPKIDEIQKRTDELYENYAEYDDLSKNIDDYFKDEVISLEEIGIIEKKYDKFSFAFLDFKKDQAAPKEKQEEVVKTINEAYEKNNIDANYDISKLSLPTSIVAIAVTVLYFGVLQYFLKGQTIFKKIFRLRVVSSNDKKVTFLKFIGRSLLLYSLLLGNVVLLALKNIFLVTTSIDTYQVILSIINNIEYVYQIVFVLFVIIRDDQRGIHDLLFHTKVIRYNKDNTIDESVLFTDSIEENKDEKGTTKDNKSLSSKSTK